MSATTGKTSEKVPIIIMQPNEDAANFLVLVASPCCHLEATCLSSNTHIMEFEEDRRIPKYRSKRVQEAELCEGLREVEWEVLQEWVSSALPTSNEKKELAVGTFSLMAAQKLLLAFQQGREHPQDVHEKTQPLRPLKFDYSPPVNIPTSPSSLTLFFLAAYFFKTLAHRDTRGSSTISVGFPNPAS